MKDVADVSALSDDEIDQLILDRVENGDTLGAVKLLHEKRGYTLYDAKKFVDGLTARLYELLPLAKSSTAVVRRSASA